MSRARTVAAIAAAVVLVAVVPLASADPPGVSIDSTPANPTTATGASFAFSSADVSATFDCDLDGSSASCSSPAVYAGLADGSHTFTVQATNATLEISSAAFTWTVDTTAPPVPTISSGPTGTVNDPTPTFGFSSAGAASLSCSSDDPTPTTPCNGGSFIAGTLTDAAHTFYVTAADALGNTSAAASRAFTVDTTPPPVPTISSGPTGTVNDPTPTFGFSSAGAASLSCSSDDPTPTTPCNGGSFIAGTLTDAAHTFYVTAADALGNTSAAASRAFTVDTTPPPVPTISSGPTGTVNDPTPTFGFSSAGAAGYRCSIGDPTPNTLCNSGSFIAGTLTDAAHTFYVTAADALGNTSAAASRTFTLDTTAPDTTIATAIPATSPSSTQSVAFTSADGAATFMCKLDTGAFAPCSSPDGLTGLTDGAHTFSVRATDAAGNVDPTPASATWTVDTTPPVLTGPGSRTVEADGPGGTRLVYTVSGSEGGLALLPGAVSCTPASPATFPIGKVTVTCTAADGVGNVGTLSFNVTVVDTTPPTINAPAASFTAADASGLARSSSAVTSYLSGISATDLVSRATLTTNMPDKLAVGATSIVVTARDTAGNVAQKTVILTVLPLGKKAQPPDLTPPGPVRNAKAKSGNRAVVLTWAPPTASDLASVRVVRSLVGGSATTTVYRGRGSTFTSKGLKNGATYRFVLVAFDKSGNSSKPVVVSATPTALLLASPKPGARVVKAPLLRWAPVASAKYFNVQLYRGGKKILSAWPSAARLQLSASWSYAKLPYTLKPGRYTWYVWPGVGARSAAVYGPLLGTSEFVVTTVRV